MPIKERIKKHKKKTIAGISLASVIAILQMLGMLTPVICALPFIHDSASCMKIGAVITTTAQGLHQLDNMVLDDGTPLQVETVVNEDTDAP